MPDKVVERLRREYLGGGAYVRRIRIYNVWLGLRMRTHENKQKPLCGSLSHKLTLSLTHSSQWEGGLSILNIL